MQGKECGFSLIEALIAVLVLAIGFTGLAQLQSRLWASAGERHSKTDALLVVSNLVEHARGVQPAITGSIPAVNPKKRAFNTSRTTNKRGNILYIQSVAKWPARTGQASVRLRSAQYLPTDRYAARWLLAPPILWSLPGS